MQRWDIQERSALGGQNIPLLVGIPMRRCGVGVGTPPRQLTQKSCLELPTILPKIAAMATLLPSPYYPGTLPPFMVP